MISFLINIIDFIIRALTLVIVIQALLSFVVPPYHPIRMWLDRFVEPMLAPIRRVVPPFGGLDFSPFVFIILLNIVGYILTNLLIRLSF